MINNQSEDIELVICGYWLKEDKISKIMQRWKKGFSNQKDKDRPFREDISDYEMEMTGFIPNERDFKISFDKAILNINSSDNRSVAKKMAFIINDLSKKYKSIGKYVTTICLEFDKAWTFYVESHFHNTDLRPHTFGETVGWGKTATSPWILLQSCTQAPMVMTSGALEGNPGVVFHIERQDRTSSGGASAVLRPKRPMI